MSSDPTPRYALYYAPELSDPLWQAGCAWLGRDPATGAPAQDAATDGQAAFTASARRYGFHATISPPMALAGCIDDFLSDVAALSATLAPFPLPRLRMAEDEGFMALRLTAPSDALHELGARCVRTLHRHRLPESAEQVARRAQGCNERQKALLHRWGYPFVLDEWRFHMTLADCVPPEPVRRQMDATFAPALAAGRRFASLCVFEEAHPGAPFSPVARFPLAGRS